jgi:hypothetical protein
VGGYTSPEHTTPWSDPQATPMMCTQEAMAH